jgi:hypothetical protein
MAFYTAVVEQLGVAVEEDAHFADAAVFHFSCDFGKEGFPLEEFTGVEDRACGELFVGAHFGDVCFLADLDVGGKQFVDFAAGSDLSFGSEVCKGGLAADKAAGQGLHREQGAVEGGFHKPLGELLLQDADFSFDFLEQGSVGFQDRLPPLHGILLEGNLCALVEEVLASFSAVFDEIFGAEGVGLQTCEAKVGFGERFFIGLDAGSLGCDTALRLLDLGRQNAVVQFQKQVSCFDDVPLFHIQLGHDTRFVARQWDDFALGFYAADAGDFAGILAPHLRVGPFLLGFGLGIGFCIAATAGGAGKCQEKTSGEESNLLHASMSLVKLGRRFGLHAAFVHVDDAVGVLAQAHVVGDDGKCDAFFAQGAEFFHDLFHAFDVERCRWFVAEHELRFGHKGAGDGNPLLLPATEGFGQLFAAVHHAHGGDGLFGSLPSLLLGHALKLQREHDILLRRKWRNQVKTLKDEADFLESQLGEFFLGKPIHLGAIEDDIAVAGVNYATQQGKQGRLARARRANDEGELVFEQFEVGRIQGRDDLITGLVGFGRAFQFGDGLCI